MNDSRDGTASVEAPSAAGSFDDRYTALFTAQYPRLLRVLGRMSGDPDLAADVAQDAFVRLYRRGALPDTPQAWLISVALNLLRNAMTTRSRRRRLMTVSRGAHAHSDPAPAPDEVTLAGESRARVRSVLDTLPERDQQILFLSAEGYAYREIADALALREASVGTLLARARRAFRQRWDGHDDAR